MAVPRTIWKLVVVVHWDEQQTAIKEKTEDQGEDLILLIIFHPVGYIFNIRIILLFDN